MRTVMAVNVIMLGAEGCAEVADEPWIRESTPDEIEAVNRTVSLEGRSVESSSIDDTGRPYWPMTILDNAPDHIKKYAERNFRVLRLPNG